MSGVSISARSIWKLACSGTSRSSLLPPTGSSRSRARMASRHRHVLPLPARPTTKRTGMCLLHNSSPIINIVPYAVEERRAERDSSVKTRQPVRCNPFRVDRKSRVASTGGGDGALPPATLVRGLRPHGCWVLLARPSVRASAPEDRAAGGLRRFGRAQYPLLGDQHISAGCI